MAVLGISDGKLVEISDEARRSGLYILGKPGMGKSSLMVNLINEDLKKGHIVFFIDPHGDGIIFLFATATAFYIPYLFTPEHELESFGINLLSCSDITSLTARTDTYTRAYNVFYKTFENEWGRGCNSSFKIRYMPSSNPRNIRLPRLPCF